jgi:hypothetical protein
VAVPHKSPRDFKPWETLPKAFNVIDGVYLYQQAAREIADAEGWDDSKLDKLLITGLCALHWKQPALYGSDRDRWKLPEEIAEQRHSGQTTQFKS